MLSDTEHSGKSKVKNLHKRKKKNYPDDLRAYKSTEKHLKYYKQWPRYRLELKTFTLKKWPEPYEEQSARKGILSPVLFTEQLATNQKNFYFFELQLFEADGILQNPQQWAMGKQKNSANRANVIFVEKIQFAWISFLANIIFVEKLRFD